MMTNDSKDQVRTSADQQFEDWFVQNYPGPDTIIYNPRWHAPRILRAAKAALATSASALARDEASAASVSADALRRNVRLRLKVEKLASLLTKTEEGKRDIVAEENEVTGVRIGWGAWALLRAAIIDVIEHKCEFDEALAASSAATVSDAASVAFSDTEIAALRVAADALIERYAAPIRGILQRAEHATAAGAQDERAAFVDEIFKRYAPAWYSDHPEVCRTLARELFARAASSATTAMRDVLAERERQVTAEGWAPEHDDEHGNGELARAAASYALHAATRLPNARPVSWPWSAEWWKPTTPRRDLVKAGALILAEIERLDRAQSTNGEQS